MSVLRAHCFSIGARPADQRAGRAGWAALAQQHPCHWLETRRESCGGSCHAGLARREGAGRGCGLRQHLPSLGNFAYAFANAFANAYADVFANAFAQPRRHAVAACVPGMRHAG
jgi:hypothetical protein